MPPGSTPEDTGGRGSRSPRPTIRDIAARAGVSKSLVSLALGNAPRVAPATREAILAAAEELGYRRNAAAQALGAHRTRTIGVFALDLHNPITADLLQAVQAEARRRDYRTIVVVGGEDPAAERAELEKLLEFRVEGIIALGHRLPHGAPEAFTADCPAVVIGSQHPGIAHLVSMSTDDVAGASLAVDHLVALGHERIVHVDGGSSAVARDRRRGYRAAMRRHGLAAHAIVVTGSFTDEGGYARRDSSPGAPGPADGPVRRQRPRRAGRPGCGGRPRSARPAGRLGHRLRRHPDGGPAGARPDDRRAAARRARDARRSPVVRPSRGRDRRRARRPGCRRPSSSAGPRRLPRRGPSGSRSKG